MKTFGDPCRTRTCNLLLRRQEKKRAELRRKLIDLGETRIATGGIEQIKARDLASEAGSAVMWWRPSTPPPMRHRLRL